MLRLATFDTLQYTTDWMRAGVSDDIVHPHAWLQDESLHHVGEAFSKDRQRLGTDLWSPYAAVALPSGSLLEAAAVAASDTVDLLLDDEGANPALLYGLRGRRNLPTQWDANLADMLFARDPLTAISLTAREVKGVALSHEEVELAPGGNVSWMAASLGPKVLSPIKRVKHTVRIFTASSTGDPIAMTLAHDFREMVAPGGTDRADASDVADQPSEFEHIVTPMHPADGWRAMLTVALIHTCLLYTSPSPRDS